MVVPQGDIAFMTLSSSGMTSFTTAIASAARFCAMVLSCDPFGADAHDACRGCAVFVHAKLDNCYGRSCANPLQQPKMCRELPQLQQHIELLARLCSCTSILGGAFVCARPPALNSGVVSAAVSAVSSIVVAHYFLKHGIQWK